MMERFPNLVKQIDIQVQEVQSASKDESKDTHTKIHQSKCPNLKSKERILKASIEKQLSTKELP